MINWSPFTIGLFLGVLIIFGINNIFRKRIENNTNTNKLYYQLTTFLLSNFLILILIINTPLSENIKSQLISLLGIAYTAAIALSSTTFMGNVMAGLMLKVLNKMRPGDFINIEKSFGRVTELGLLHTEIQTLDRDLTTLPNLYLVSNPVKVIRYSGTIISEDISLGYDIHHNKVEESLIKAAHKTGIEEPFVHVQKLGDFSITYRVHGFLKDVKTIISTKSKLRENILDALHGDKIEIVSPNFMNQRVLAQDKEFIPRFQKDTVQTQEHPENIIFDKADEAESIENLKLKAEEINKQLGQLKNENKENKEDVKDKVEFLTQRLDILNDIIKTKTKKE